MTTKEFHIGDVLSVTTGILVSPRGFGGGHAFLQFLTGDVLPSSALPQVGRICKPHLLEQFPQLKKVDASGVNKGNWKQWLAEQVARYGEKLTVTSLP